MKKYYYVVEDNAGELNIQTIRDGILISITEGTRRNVFVRGDNRNDIPGDHCILAEIDKGRWDARVLGILPFGGDPGPTGREWLENVNF